MKTIIAGSRGISGVKIVEKAIKAAGWIPTTVVSGTADGVDRSGEQWATINGVSVERHPAEWDKFGKSAGYKRNEVMAKVSEALIAIWDGKSRGTMHMIELAMKYNLRVYVYRTDDFVLTN